MNRYLRRSCRRGSEQRVVYTQLPVAGRSAMFLFPDPQAWWRWIWTMGWRMTLQQLTDEACEDSRRKAMQHLAAIVGHDGLRTTHSTTYLLAVAP